MSLYAEGSFAILAFFLVVLALAMSGGGAGAAVPKPSPGGVLGPDHGPRAAVSAGEYPDPDGALDFLPRARASAQQLEHVMASSLTGGSYSGETTVIRGMFVEFAGAVRRGLARRALPGDDPRLAPSLAEEAALRRESLLVRLKSVEDTHPCPLTCERVRRIRLDFVEWSRGYCNACRRAASRNANAPEGVKKALRTDYFRGVWSDTFPDAYNAQCPDPSSCAPPPASVYDAAGF
jgi:hypothetical protein